MARSYLRIYWEGVDEPQELNFSGSLADVMGELFAFTMNVQLQGGESSSMTEHERLDDSLRAAKAASKVVELAVKQVRNPFYSAGKKARQVEGVIPWFGYDPIHYALRVVLG